MLGQYLKNYRVKNNLTQKQMAKLIKTSQSYYSLVESEKIVPGFNFIERLAKVVDQKPAFIRNLI